MIYENAATDEQVRSRFAESFAAVGLPAPRVVIYDLVDSTNTRAKLFAENNPGGGRAPVIFFAREQTGGRGTRGREFESPVGGAYFSLLIYPELGAVSALSLTTLAAVAALRALRALTADMAGLGIKWVNDITVRDKKLGGILTEGRVGEGGILEYAIVGIGINTNRAPHSDGVSALMTTLEDEGISLGAEELAAAVCAHLIAALPELGSEATRLEYAKSSTVVGRRVTVVEPHVSYTATVKRINPDLSLSVITEDGEERTIISADVSLRVDK